MFVFLITVVDMQQYYQLDIIDGVLFLKFLRKPSSVEIKSAIEQASMLGNIRLRLWEFPENCLFSEDELLLIRTKTKKIWPGPSRSAILADERLATVFQNHLNQIVESKEHKTKVFRQKAAALSWLHNGE